MKGSLRPGTPDFPRNVQQIRADKINNDNILFTFLGIDSPIAVEAALRVLKLRCAVKPSLKLAAKVVEVAERKKMHLLPFALQTEGEARYNSGDFFARVSLERAETLFSTSTDDASVVGEMVCHVLRSESATRGAPIDNSKEWKQAAEYARTRLSTLSSETGKRGHSHNLLALQVAELSRDSEEQNKLVSEARTPFEGLGDGYGLTLCDVYSERSRLPIDLALKFQDFGDFERAAKCYQNAFCSVIHPVVHLIADASGSIEYIKVNGIRELILEVVTRLPQLLDWIKKAIDLYELLGRNLDAAFCRYHLAQLLPPAEAIDLYSHAIYQFGRFTFTHHRERATLDQCYSLVEAKEYSAAIPTLERLQHGIRYCGEIFQLRCQELLVESATAVLMTLVRLFRL
jgi:tetratricopeptide (TPR) repeat protein